MKKRIPYGICNFRAMIDDNYYYVDKTSFIEKLEPLQISVFLRPRRFGKSLFTEMLRWYYDLKAKADFERLFGKLYIGKTPTPRRNSYYFLGLDFSGTGGYSANDKDFARHSFNQSIIANMIDFLEYYREELGIDREYIKNFEETKIDNAATALTTIVDLVKRRKGKMYLAIDEYDALTNAMAIHYINEPEEKNEYLNVTKKGGFFRQFFETIKMCLKSALDKVYITGILPITISDMNSGFNNVEWIAHDQEYSNMLGITESELEALLVQAYTDYPGTVIPKAETKRYLKLYYNGYKFGSREESVYNPMMTMYFLNHVIHKKRLPHLLADQNIRVQYNQVAYIFGENAARRDEVLADITGKKALDFTVTPGRLFDLFDYKSGSFINECLYYLGLLTYGNKPKQFVVPNIVTYEMLLSYFERIKDFEIEKKNFDKHVIYYMRNGKIEELVKAFFEEIIQKFPGDFFKDVNESFYRGLFYHALALVLPTDMYEVLPEFNLPSGTVDLLVKSLPHRDLEAPVTELIEIKRVPKSASDAQFAAKFEDAKQQVLKYKAGDYKEFRAAAICFRGNKDYRIELL